MIRNEEAERLAKEKEAWAKEDRLSKEEYVRSWTSTIENLEKIYKNFNSNKINTEIPLWICEGDYSDEDKLACKKEVISILKLCGKEDVLINRPAVANLIYVNRLRKREATKKDDVMEEPLPQERLQQEKETMQESSDINSEGKKEQDTDNQFSEHAIECGDKFLRYLEDKEYIDCYRKWLEMVIDYLRKQGKSKEESVNKTIDAEGLVTKKYDKWIKAEDRKRCWLETVKILKVCGKSECLNSNLNLVAELFRDRLIKNRFVEEVEKAEGLVLATEQRLSDDTTAAARACDTPDVKNNKSIADNETSNAKEQGRIARRRSKAKEHLEAILKNQEEKQNNRGKP